MEVGSNGRNRSHIKKIIVDNFMIFYSQFLYPLPFNPLGCHVLPYKGAVDCLRQTIR